MGKGGGDLRYIGVRIVCWRWGVWRGVGIADESGCLRSFVVVRLRVVKKGFMCQGRLSFDEDCSQKELSDSLESAVFRDIRHIQVRMQM